jgi:hypothetical protein
MESLGAGAQANPGSAPHRDPDSTRSRGRLQSTREQASSRPSWPSGSAPRRVPVCLRLDGPVARRWRPASCSCCCEPALVSMTYALQGQAGISGRAAPERASARATFRGRISTRRPEECCLSSDALVSSVLGRTVARPAKRKRGG